MKERKEGKEDIEIVSIPRTNIWVLNVSSRQEPLEFVSEILGVEDSKLSLVNQDDFCDVFIRKSEKLLKNHLPVKADQNQYRWNRFLMASQILRDGINIIEEGEKITLNPVLIDHFQGKLSYSFDGFARGAEEAKKLIRSSVDIREKGNNLQKELEQRPSLNSDILPQHAGSLNFIFV